jgi:hypothetical protein
MLDEYNEYLDFKAIEYLVCLLADMEIVDKSYVSKLVTLRQGIFCDECESLIDSCSCYVRYEPQYDDEATYEAYDVDYFNK